MTILQDEHVNSTSKDDFLIKEIIQTHDPDDRYLDSDLLLHLVETTFFSTTADVFDAQLGTNSIDNIDLIGSEEPISFIIYKISNEILSQCYEDENLHTKTLALLEILSQYAWDAKVVIALASFACSFGLFCLILQLQPDSALAETLAAVKQLPFSTTKLKTKLKALNLLVNTMVKLTKVIVSFEVMSPQHELVDANYMDVTKSLIYVATYWIFRSILLCSSQIVDLRNMALEHSDKTVIEALGLHSAGSKLDSLYHDLGKHVIKCHQQIETRFYEKLMNTFKESGGGNQNALRAVFASPNEFPLKNSSGEKCKVLELDNRVVILLISKPELLPIDEAFLLVQHMRDFEGKYAVVWLPVVPSSEWSVDDKVKFEFFSNCLPWFSVRRPWSVNPTVVKYIIEEWEFKEDPIMVVLNENGVMTNSNAMDMVWIWGRKAYPFSSSMEKELWKEESGAFSLMINGISPVIDQWVEEEKNLCIFGSNNLDLINKFTSTMMKVKSVGIEFEVVYVGCNNPSDNVKTIIDTIDKENLCTALTFTKARLFWLRLESLKRCLHNQKTCAAELGRIVELSNHGIWAVIGRGSSNDVLELDAEKVEKCIEAFSLWAKNVGAMGLVGALRRAIDPPLEGEKCSHTELVRYEEGSVDKPLVCASCKGPMEKFVLYKCDE